MKLHLLSLSLWPRRNWPQLKHSINRERKQRSELIAQSAVLFCNARFVKDYSTSSRSSIMP
jgi:hypothetical protein